MNAERRYWVEPIPMEPCRCGEGMDTLQKVSELTGKTRRKSVFICFACGAKFTEWEEIRATGRHYWTDDATENPPPEFIRLFMEGNK